MPKAKVPEKTTRYLALTRADLKDDSGDPLGPTLCEYARWNTVLQELYANNAAERVCGVEKTEEGKVLNCVNIPLMQAQAWLDHGMEAIPTDAVPDPDVLMGKGMKDG